MVASSFELLIFGNQCPVELARSISSFHWLAPGFNLHQIAEPVFEHEGNIFPLWKRFLLNGHVEDVEQCLTVELFDTASLQLALNGAQYDTYSLTEWILAMLQSGSYFHW